MGRRLDLIAGKPRHLHLLNLEGFPASTGVEWLFAETTSRNIHYARFQCGEQHFGFIITRQMEAPSARAARLLLRQPRPLASSCLNRRSPNCSHIPTALRRSLQTSSYLPAATTSFLGSASAPSSGTTPSSYFQRPSLPANTIIRFVPQQTAWIVERMGKYNRILQPGLAILIPFIDRIAYVKSLKEAAMEIPSQSAITADNVTLELDGVLYTRVIDAYRARFVPAFHNFSSMTL